jgi:hypothetical protein
VRFAGVKIAALPCYSFVVGPLAQRLEQRTHNPLVEGSNPSGPTNSSTTQSRRGQRRAARVLWSRKFQLTKPRLSCSSAFYLTLIVPRQFADPQRQGTLGPDFRNR